MGQIIAQLERAIRYTAAAIGRVERKRDQITKDMISFDPDTDLFRDYYDEQLDEIYRPVKVAGLELSPSEVIRKCDPTAYQTFLNDFVGTLSWNELADHDSRFADLKERSEIYERLNDSLDRHLINLETKLRTAQRAGQ